MMGIKKGDKIIAMSLSTTNMTLKGVATKGAPGTRLKRQILGKAPFDVSRVVPQALRHR